MTATQLSLWPTQPRRCAPHEDRPDTGLRPHPDTIRVGGERRQVETINAGGGTL